MPPLPGPSGVVIPGDGNGDGVVDARQTAVSSIEVRQTPTISLNPQAPATFVTVVAGGEQGKAANGTAQVSAVTQADTPATVPARMQTPLGQLQLTATTAPGVARQNFSVYVDAQLAVNGYWVRNKAGVWVNLAATPQGGAVVQEGGKRRLDLSVQDGGPFDADGQLNGSVFQAQLNDVAGIFATALQA